MTTTRLGATAFAVSGVLLAAYPIVRPYPDDELSPAGAEALSASAWIVSHAFAMVAFILLLPALLALRRHTAARAAWSHGGSRRSAGGSESARGGGAPGAAVVLAWLGTVFVLPYYGAETFALSAAGEHARTTGDLAVLVATESFRWAPVAVTSFGVGLLLLAGAGIALIITTWAGGGLARVSGLLAGLGLGAYLPQFFLPAAGRIGHGVLLGAGLVLLAVWLLRRRRQRAAGERYAAGAEPPTAATSSSTV